MKKSDQSYRKGIGIVVGNGKGRYFTAKRVQKNIDAWQMPQGGIEKDENPVDAMKRELYEETGIKTINIRQQTREWLFYDLPVDIIPLVWNGKYKGQQQHWFLVHFTGADDEINLNTSEPPEFDQWKWAESAEIIEKAVDFKKDLYKQVFKEFQIL